MAGCSYGGLAAFEIIKGISYEILSLCNKKTNLLTKHRNIYSTEEKLLVVVYSYRNYSRIRVQLKITSIVCEVIRVDICKLQKLTGSKLANYVRKITQFSTLNFFVKNPEIGLIPDVVFDLNQSYCSFLQLYTKSAKRFEYICQTSFRSTLTFTNYDLDYTLTGFLIYRNISESDRIFMFGESEEFCVNLQTDRIHKMNCARLIRSSEQRPQSSGQIFPFFSIGYDNNDKYNSSNYNILKWNSGEIKMIDVLTNNSVLFHLNFKSGNPKPNSQLNYRIYLKEMSVSWIDVKIERTAKMKYRAVGQACWSVSERFEIIPTSIYAVKRAAASDRQAFFLTFNIGNKMNSQKDPFLVIDISINSTFYSEYLNDDWSAFFLFQGLEQQQILMWKSTINFTSNKILYIVCLSTETADIQINRTNHTNIGVTDFILAAYWYIYVTGFEYFSDVLTFHCGGYDHKHIDHKYRECKKSTEFSIPEYPFRLPLPVYYIFLLKRSLTNIWADESKALLIYMGIAVPVPDFKYSPKLNSWNEISADCKRVGASLPRFRSRRELQELLAFLKLSKDHEIPPVEAVFIDLHFRKVVSFFCMSLKTFEIHLRE